jgi:hypothetical protein
MEAQVSNEMLDSGERIPTAGGFSTQWHRPVSPAITEQLCKTVTEHETRHKSLLEMCNDRYQLALTNTPEGLSEQERFLWRMGFAEGMSVVLEYIKSGQPAPR